MAGVIRTRVGYAGGIKENPTYYDLGDHTETVQIDYDPERVSFEELLEVFWNSHNPTRRPWSRQYASIAFYHDEEQRQAILASKERRERSSGQQIYTEVRELDHFYLAEGYHQKYFLRNTPEIMREFQAMYPNEADIVDSTAAARANGYLGGYGDPEVLREELSSYGLSPRANQTLLSLVGRRAR
jgi:methionine-S-sulfoxide reductase